MPRTADPKKIERLLAATRQWLIRCGFGGASIERICQDAGISKGVFFHYFKTKEDAVIRVAREFVAELSRQFKAAGTQTRNADPRQRILDYIDFTLSACEHSVLSSGCLIGSLSMGLPPEQAGIRGVCHEAFNNWVTSFEALLQTAQQAGALPQRVDSRTLACQFIALVEGSLLLRNALGAEVLRRNLQGFRGMLEQLMDPRRGAGR